jgi:hypothetical protein
MCKEEPSALRHRNPAHGIHVPEMNADEAIAMYHAWRQRVVGSRKTRADTIEELYVQLRDPPVRHN